MNMQKFTILILIILFFAYSASAQQGCFIYEDSPFYCTSISAEKAQQECSSYENCNYKTSFIENQDCSYAVNFPQCQKVLCKSSCKQEYSGKCLSGAILQGEENKWCSSGCCQFSFNGGDYCSFADNKWKCEIEAKNKEAAQYIFAFPSSQNDCQQSCQQGLLGDIETVSPNAVLLSIQLYEQQNNVSAIPSQIKQKDSLFFQWILFLAVVSGMVYLLHAWWRWSKRNSLRVPREETPTAVKLFRLIQMGSSSISKRLQKLRLTRKDKVKHQAQKELFQDFPAAAPQKEDTFSKLQEVVSHHRPKKEKHSIENLEQLKELSMKNEQKARQNKDAQKAIEKLKELTRK